VAATLLVSLVTAVVFGLVPAVQASRLDVQRSLAGTESRSVAGRSKHWPRRLLVVTEVALGVALLVTAGLLLRTFVGLRSLDPGFDPAQLVTTSVSLQDARYADAASVNRLFDDSVDRLLQVPGVESAGISLQLPYDRLLNLGFRYVEDPDSQAITNMAYITPGFLDTLRIPLRQGRDLSDRDTAAAPPVVLVNETFVKFYSPDQNPVGRRMVLSGVEREIVGVTGDVQQRASFMLDGMTPGPLVSAPLVFMPASQVDDSAFQLIHTWFRPVWSVRAATPALGASALRQTLREVDPLLPVAEVQSMGQVMERATSIERLLTTLVGVLAAAALLLAAIGIHGLIAHAVGERRREFGIRMALGATAGRTMARVALGGLTLAGVGVIAGGLLSIWAVTLVESFLWGVAPTDPLTYVAASVFLLVVAAVASVLPASRILRLDPAATLRS
jgi:predicted permease